MLGGVRLTASPISEHHAQPWKTMITNATSDLGGMLMNRSWNGPPGQQTLVLSYDPPLRLPKLPLQLQMGVPLLVRVHARLMQSVEMFMEALLDRATDETRQLVAELVRESIPLFAAHQCVHDVLPNAVFQFRHVPPTNDKTRDTKGVVVARLMVGAHTNTIDLDLLLLLPPETTHDSESLNRRLRQRLTEAEVDALPLASPYTSKGRVSLTAPRSLSELLFLHRLVMALMESVAMDIY
jgi:hypothetical protein